MVPLLWMILKGKIEIAHLLPEWSARREDYFLKTWPCFSNSDDEKKFLLKIADFENGVVSKFQNQRS